MPPADDHVSTGAGSSSWSGRHAVSAGLLLFFTAVAAYVPAMTAGFVWDDELEVVGNQVLQSQGGFAEVWRHGDTADYYPLKSTVQWVAWRLWGPNPMGYHLVNIGFHAFGAVLLWRWLARLRVPGAWLAGLLFAVHPVNVESVAWISELKNTLSLFFFVLTLLYYARNEERPSGITYAAALVSYLAALLSKSSVVPLPVVLLIAAFWQRGTITLRDLRRALPFFLLAAAFSVVAVELQFQRAIGHALISTTPQGDWPTRIAGAGIALGFYLFHAVAPVGLVMVYPIWHLGPLQPWQFLPWVGFAAIFAICLVHRDVLGRGPVCALSYFVVLLSPVLGFVKMSYMWHSLVADHFEYLALIGIVALEAGAGAELARRRPGLRPALAGLAVFVIAAFGALSWAHEAIFSNEEALWRDTLRMNPDTWAGHERLGGILASRGLEAEGLEHFNEAVGDSTSQTLARANLGNALSRAGREREAIEQYKIGLTLEDTPLMRTMLGLVYASSGRYDEAIRQCNLALKMDPDSPQTYCALGYVHMKRKEYGPAIDDLRRSIALEPDILESHIILAQAFVDLKRDDDALPELLAVVRIEPRTPWAEALIGSIYLKKGNYPEAVSHLRNAEALNSDDASVPGLLDQALRGAQKAPCAR